MAGAVQEDRVVREIDVYLADHASEDNKARVPLRRLVTASRGPSPARNGGERIGQRAACGCTLRVWCRLDLGAVASSAAPQRLTAADYRSP
jgi:hypothetical protein